MSSSNAAASSFNVTDPAALQTLMHPSSAAFALISGLTNEVNGVLTDVGIGPHFVAFSGLPFTFWLAVYPSGTTAPERAQCVSLSVVKFDVSSNHWSWLLTWPRGQATGEEIRETIRTDPWNNDRIVIPKDALKRGSPKLYARCTFNERIQGVSGLATVFVVQFQPDREWKTLRFSISNRDGGVRSYTGGRGGAYFDAN